MTETDRTNQERREQRWGRWTIGLGAMTLVVGAAVIMAIQAPSVAAMAWADESVDSDALRQAAVLRDVTSDSDGVLSISIPDPTSTPAPTVTRQPIATATPRSTASRTLVKKSAPQVLPKPEVPVEPLGFSFWSKAWCATRKIQNLTLMLTAHGGRPPYDYYNGDVLLAKGEKGRFRYSRDAPAGNPVPYKILIVDSLGQRYSEDFFFKTHLSCGF